MPRIYTGDNDPLDFCTKHFPKNEVRALAKYGKGEGPDDRGNCFSYEAEHPDYESDIYRCAVCNNLLRDKDN